MAQFNITTTGTVATVNIDDLHLTLTHPQNIDILNELNQLLNIKNTESKKKNGLLNNQTFMLTGKLNGMSRAEAKSLIEDNSGTTVSSVSKKLDYLIIGDKPTKRKVETAKELGISTIDQKQFLKMLNIAS